MAEQQRSWRVRPSDIVYTVKMLKVFAKGHHKVLDIYHWEAMKRIHNKTKATTMVATGETLSTLFRIRRQFSGGTSHIVGYGPTTNNQSFMQEFDDGKVHRRKKDHFHKLVGFGREGERAKCSRVPEDLWAHTHTYKFNPKARRRALARSIEEEFGTRVTFAVKAGGNLHYRPSLTAHTRKLSGVSRLVISKVFQ